MVIGGGVQPTRVVYLMLHCNADQARDNRHDTPFSSAPCRRAHLAHPDRYLDLGCQDVGIGSISRLMRPRIPRPAGVSVSSGLESHSSEPHPECHHRERDGRPHGWQVASLSASRSRHRAGASTSPVAPLPGAGRQPLRESPRSPADTPCWCGDRANVAGRRRGQRRALHHSGGRASHPGDIVATVTIGDTGPGLPLLGPEHPFA